jgi:F-type H+-transporting ATPase subunit epsilon
MKELTVELVTPQGKLFEDQAQAVTLPGATGSFQVLFNHAPIVSALDKGTVKIKQTGGEKRYTIEGGFVEVSANKVAILAERATEVA